LVAVRPYYFKNCSPEDTGHRSPRWEEGREEEEKRLGKTVRKYLKHVLGKRVSISVNDNVSQEAEGSIPIGFPQPVFTGDATQVELKFGPPVVPCIV
jgi:hypothetical protein